MKEKKPMRRLTALCAALTLLIVSCGCAAAAGQPEPSESVRAGAGPVEGGSTVTKDTTVGEVTANPALEDFGRLLFPVDRSVPSDMTLEEVSSSSVYVWYSHIQPDKTVEIVNHVISRAEQGAVPFGM